MLLDHSLQTVTISKGANNLSINANSLQLRILKIVNLLSSLLYTGTFADRSPSIWLDGVLSPKSTFLSTCFFWSHRPHIEFLKTTFTGYYYYYAQSRIEFKTRACSEKVGPLIFLYMNTVTVLARDVIYTSRAYATMSVSVCDGSALAHYS